MQPDLVGIQSNKGYTILMCGKENLSTRFLQPGVKAWYSGRMSSSGIKMEGVMNLFNIFQYK